MTQTSGETPRVSPRRATAIPLRSLGDTQLATVKRAAALVERGSVLVGALPGMSLEDLRPLFLRQGRLHILRMIQPAPELVPHVSEVVEPLNRCPAVESEFSVAGEQVWYVRPFVQNLLWESEARLPEWTPQEVAASVQGVFADALALIDHGGFHGAVLPQNIGVVDRRLQLIDPCARFLLLGITDDGLRLGDGMTVLQQADLIALAGTVFAYFSEEQLAPVKEWLTGVKQSTVGASNVIELVREQVESFKLPDMTSAVAGATTSDGGARKLGKILPQGLAVAPLPDSREKEKGEPDAEKTAEAAQPDAPDQTLIPLTDDQIVSVKPPPAQDRAKKPSAEEVLSWAENTTSLSKDVVSQIRNALKGGVPEDRDKNPFLEEDAPEKEPFRGRAPQSVALESEQDLPFLTGLPESKIAQKSGDATRSSVSLIPFVAVLFVGIASIYYARESEFLTRYFQAEPEEIQYAAYWTSNIPSKMRAVAIRAVEQRDPEAEIVIVQDALADNRRPNVRTDLLQVAFNPIWEQSLSDTDRKLALMLGLSNLLPPELSDVPSLRNAHPGVILAAMASLPLKEEVGPVAAIPVGAVAELPSPFREAFAALEAMQVETFANPAARALARITLGATSTETLTVFFDSASSPVEAVGLLRSLREVMKLQPDLPDRVLTVIVQSENEMQQGVQWFDSDPFTLWEGLPALDRIKILSGFMSELRLGIEQLADLLRFPHSHVRQHAVQRLQNMPFAQEQQETIQALARPDFALSREQVVSLMVALAKKDESRDSLISLWFSTNPDPRAVLELVLTRVKIESGDTFSLEAARYLKDKKWAATLEEKKMLSSHREMLVRALIYTRLDPEVPAERKLLENMQAVEPNPILREQLFLKLDEAGGFSKEGSGDSNGDSDSELFADDLAGAEG